MLKDDGVKEEVLNWNSSSNMMSEKLQYLYLLEGGGGGRIPPVLVRALLPPAQRPLLFPPFLGPHLLLSQSQSDAEIARALR